MSTKLQLTHGASLVVTGDLDEAYTKLMSAKQADQYADFEVAKTSARVLVNPDHVIHLHEPKEHKAASFN